MSIKDQILTAVDLSGEEVWVEEWGVTVRIRTMTGWERDAFEEDCAKTPYANIRARLVGQCMVDDTGKRIFGASEIGELGNKSAKVLDRLFEIASRLNGVGQADVEAMEKNS